MMPKPSDKIKTSASAIGMHGVSRSRGTSTIVGNGGAIAPVDRSSKTDPVPLPASTIAGAQASPDPNDQGQADLHSRDKADAIYLTPTRVRLSSNNGDVAEPAELSKKPQPDPDWEALLREAFGPFPSAGAPVSAMPDEADAGQLGEVSKFGAEADKSARADYHAAKTASDETDLDPSSIAYVEADVAATQAKIDRPDGGPAMSPSSDSDEPQTDNEFEAFFREAAEEKTPPQPTVPTKSTSLPPVPLARGLRAALEAARVAQAIEVATEGNPRRRGRSRRKRVVEALRAFIEDDPGYRGKCELNQEMDRLFNEARAAADAAQRKITAAYDAFIASIRLREDFYLIHLAAFADRIERCGTEWAFACGSYWCSHCRKRFGARLLEDTQAQLTQRYGANPEQWRRHILHVTILDEIVIPDPDLDPDLLASFSASTIRRDHREILGHLRRLQEDRRSALSARLAKRGLTLELIKDWLTVGDRDRTYYSPDNEVIDAARLIEFDAVSAAARAHFKPRSKRPDLESDELISWRDQERVEAYMWQLRKAQPLDRDDVIAITHDLQFIDREFHGITKTNYPERLKFKSSIEKVIKRERSKLYRLSKDLPGVSLIGVFELELVDLRHAIGGDHQHSVKAKTVRALASQERKPTKYRKSDEPISWETRRRREKTAFKNRLLDEARERIAANKDLPEADFQGLQYAVHLHMHVVIDLNGKSRDDVERWLTGKAVGSRRFTGQWPLPHQVMIKSLFADKPVDDSLRHISFYPIKGPLAFNYENTAPKHDEDLPEDDSRNFNDEALALLAWLQHGIGHESLRVAVNWPGVDREKRGRKPKREATPKITDEELEAALAERGVELPREPLGQTDITPLFEAAGEGARAAGPAEASTATERHEAAEGRPDSGGVMPSDRGSVQGIEEGDRNDTTLPTGDG